MVAVSGMTMTALPVLVEIEAVIELTPLNALAILSVSIRAAVSIPDAVMLAATWVSLATAAVPLPDPDRAAARVVATARAAVMLPVPVMETLTVSLSVMLAVMLPEPETVAATS